MLFFTQDLQVKATEGEALWIAFDKSYQRLVETLPHGAAQALGDPVEEERKRLVVLKCNSSGHI